MSTRSSSRKGLTRGALALACAVATSANADTDAPQSSVVSDKYSELRDKYTAVHTTNSAAKRDSQPMADPWNAPSSTALFGRPTLGESFKFSSEASKAGTVLSLGFSPGALWLPGSPALTNLQVQGAYVIGDASGSLALKWTAPFRDVRTFSNAEWARVWDASVRAYEDCEKQVTNKNEKDLAPCLEKRTAAEDAEIARVRPGLSLGVSVGYGFRSQRLERVTANVAYDQKLWSGTSLILNAAVESEPRDLQEDGVARVERTWRAGGSAGLAWRPGGDFLKQRLELSAGARVLACLRSCGEKASSVKFGPQASFALDKDTVLGASVSWSGEAVTLRDALLGVSVSHSFGLLE